MHKFHDAFHDVEISFLIRLKFYWRMEEKEGVGAILFWTHTHNCTLEVPSSSFIIIWAMMMDSIEHLSSFQWMVVSRV
jgi:hypothetical protein